MQRGWMRSCVGGGNGTKPSCANSCTVIPGSHCGVSSRRLDMKDLAFPEIGSTSDRNQGSAVGSGWL